MPSDSSPTPPTNAARPRVPGATEAEMFGPSRKSSEPEQEPAKMACPVCGGPLIEIRAKLQCRRCHTILETCCEGGRPG